MKSFSSIPVLTPMQQGLVVRYLYAVGILSACAMAFALLLFVAYLAQLVLMSIKEIVQTFDGLDPIVRLLIIFIVVVVVMWRISYKWQVTHGC